MVEPEIRVGWKALQEFVAEVFTRIGLPPEDAATEAEVLVWANLRGVDSHGVLRIPSYVEMLDTGQMNPRPKIRILHETAATLLLDADRALGPVATTLAMRRVIPKAREAGIGWALVRETTHTGAMGYYAEMAVREGLVGIALVCSRPNMAPHGARALGVHNSPIAIAVPASRHQRLMLDMATSIAAGGKLRLALDRGVPIPPGWALDKDGHPTTDAKLAAILLPAGGPKGSGLALMFECLTSIMAGNPLLAPAIQRTEASPRHHQNSVVAAVDIETFSDLGRYREDVDRLIDALKTLPRAEGTEEVLAPGEPEDRVREARLRQGIPLPGGTVRNLRRVAERFGVAFPPAL